MLTFMIWLVAILHVLFAYAEICHWPRVTKRLLGYDDGMAQKTAVLGINQGAYNAFFAVGLLVALLVDLQECHAQAVIVFCLASLAAAGLVGLLTVRHWLFLLQMVPPLLALGLMAGE